MNKLSRKVNAYVLIKRTIISLFIYAFLIVVIVIDDEMYDFIFIKNMLITVGSVLAIIAFINSFILSFYTYNKYGYYINDDEITIVTGVIFKQTVTVPIKRIEHIIKRQGPIEILMDLSSVVVYTSGSFVVLTGLDNKIGENIVKQILEKLKPYLLEEKEDD